MAYRRDKGICANCGLDCDKLERVLKYLWWRAKQTAYKPIPAAEGYWTHSPRKQQWQVWYMRAKYKYEWATSYKGPTHTWEADHEIPVIEGGGEIGMGNIRTLCVPCHRIQTKHLHQRLSDRRAR